MNIVEVRKMGTKDTPHKVDVRPLFSNRHIDTVHITLEPGESLRKHITPVDVLFYVLEGHPTFEIGEENVAVGPDSLVESPARIPHMIANASDARARILVLKVPKPIEQTQIL